MQAKLLNFISLSLTLTNLCYIKRDHLVNFHISLEKREKLRYLCYITTDLYKSRHDNPERVSQVHRPLKFRF